MADSDLWTAGDVAMRFREAAVTLGRLPPPMAQAYVSLWPSLAGAASGSIRQDKRLDGIYPAPNAIDRLDDVIMWLPWVSPCERRLLWQRAGGVPWKTICSELACHRSAAWRRWITAAEKIAASLNLSPRSFS